MVPSLTCTNIKNMNMNTITLSNATIRNAEKYAKQHNISITDAIERGVTLLLGSLQDKEAATPTSEFQQALAHIKTLKAQGGTPVPAEENDLGALVEQKYEKATQS